MGEMKGAIFTVAFFVAIIIPFFLSMGIGAINQHAFMKVATEVTEMVKEEGGITPRVSDVANRLTDKGYEITFNNNGGSTFGDQVVIHYEYKYINVRGEETLDTQNTVFISRR